MPTSPANDRSSGQQATEQAGSDKVYGHIDKILDRLDRGWRIFRPTFSNRVTLFAVAGGLALASGPIWVDLIISLAKAWNPESPILKAVSQGLEAYKAKVDAVDVVGGVVIVIVSLLYHFFSHQIEKSRSLKLFLDEREEIIKDRDADFRLVDNFNNEFPTRGFKEILAQVRVGRDTPAIQELLMRYEYWRDARVGFRNPELEAARTRLKRAHLDFVMVCQVDAGEGGRQKEIKALDVAYDDVMRVSSAYDKEISRLKEKRGIS